MFQKKTSLFPVGVLLLVLLSARLGSAGHIYSWDVSLEHQNAGEARYINLFFSLESGLPVGNQILVEFPKEISTGSDAGSCLLGVVGSTVTGGCSVSSNTKSATVINSVALSAMEWYQLRIQLTNLNGQSEGYQGVIAMSTQSSGASKIKYDTNSAFAQYQLAVKPIGTLDVVQSNPASVTSTTGLGQSNEYYFDVKPKVNVTGGSKWVFEIGGSDFTFVSTCSSQAVLCTSSSPAGCENITLLEGPCTVESSGKRLSFISTQDIVIDKKFRIKATVKNPSYKANTVGYTVSSESKLARIFFEKREFPSKFSVSELTITSPTLKFLWGTASDLGSTNSRCSIGFYKSTSTIQVFNNFVLEFKVPLTPEGQNLKVSIGIPSTNFVVLTSSLSTNLPTFTSKTMSIKVTSSAIEISNVGPLTDSSNTVYILRGRCYFDSSSAASGNFGAVKVEALASDGSVISQIGLSGGVAYTLIPNYDYIGTAATTDYHHSDNVNKYGYIFVSSKLGAVAFDNPDANALITDGTSESIRPGIPLATTDKVRALLFTILPSQAQICCKGNNCEAKVDVSTCGDGTNSFVIMMGMVANSDILSLSSTPGNGVTLLDGFWATAALTLPASCGSTVSMSRAYTQYGGSPPCNGGLLNDWVIDSANKVAHLKLHYVGNAPTAISRAGGTLPAAFYLKESTSNGGIYQSSKEQVSQLYGGQQILDFIVCFSYVAGTNLAFTLTTASQSLLNTFVIENGAESNLKIRLVNYINQGGDINYAVPVFLRVYGYLSGSSSGTTLSIFLDNNLDISTFTQGNCISSVAGVTCVTYPSSQVSLSNVNYRQRVDLMAANPQAGTTDFDHIIPVKTVATNCVSDPNTFFLDIGILGADGNDARFLTVKSITRVNGYAWGGSKLYSFSKPGNQGDIKNAITIGTSRSQTQHDSSDCGTWTTTPTLPVTDLNFDPGYIYTSGIEIKYETPSGSCLGRKDTAGMNTGVLFSHRSLDLIGSAEVKWSVADNLSCKKFSFANSDASKKAIGFYCISFKSLDGATNLDAAGAKVTLSAFTVPWRWGNKIILSELDVHQTWSRLGENTAYFAHPALAQTDNNYASGCTSSDWTAISRNTKNQQLKFTFTPTSGVDLTIDSGDELQVKAIGTGLAAAGWTEISCRAELSSGTDVLCQPVGQVFTIRGRTSGIKSSLGKALQTVYYRGNQDSTAVVEKTVYLEIWYKRASATAVKLDECDYSQKKKIPAASSEDVALLSLGDPVYVTSKSARTSFYFTFGVSNTGRQLWKDSLFEFSLGWLGELLTDISSNLHCYPRSGNAISFVFSELDLSTPSTPKLTLGSDTPLGSFTFHCNGASSPNLGGSGDIKFTWKDSSSLVLGELADLAAKKIPAATSLSDARADMLVTLESKLWNTPGFEATYIFNVTPKYDNYTVKGRIYIDFTVDLPPRGNRAGSPFCTLDGAIANCDFIEERKLSIWPSKDLPWKPSKPYQIIVYRVAQPTLFVSTYKKIAITFDADTNPYNGVSEWGYVDDLAPVSSVASSIGITAYTNSVGFTRSNVDISISMSLPADSVTKDAIYYVQLPNYWDDVLSFTPNINCVLSRETDTTSTNLIQNCSILRDYKLRFYTNLDTQESSRSNIYILKLNGFPTPHQPTPAVPAWITVFQASADQRTVTRTTAPGFINASTIIYANDPNKQNPIWFTRPASGVRTLLGTGSLDVFLGTYRSEVYLGLNDEKQVANVTYDFSLSGDSASYVLVWPQKPRVVFGVSEQKLTLGGKTGTAPGRYILTVTKTGDNNNLNSIVPALPVVLRPDPCSVNPSFTEAKIPSGGVSLPIVFDFVRCMPITDVEVTGELTSPDKFNVSFVRDNNAALLSTQKLTFSSFSDTRVSFVVYSNNASQEVGKQTTIEWKIGGTEKASYQTPLATKVTYIDSGPFKTAPVVSSFTATPSAGKVVLSVTCSATGSYFYAIGLGGSVNDFTLGQIQAKTINVKRDFVPRDSTNLDWIVYGYGDQTEPKANLIEIAGVRAGGYYNATVYCTNQLNAPSSKANVGWNQTDNGARTSRVALNFSSVLTESQQVEIACAFVKLLAIPTTQVRTQTGANCANIRLLQNSSNSSNTTSNTSTPSTITYTLYYWFVLPDYSTSSSTTHLATRELYERGNFVEQLLSQTSSGANSFGQVSKSSIDISTTLVPVPGELGSPSSPTLGLSWVQFSVGIVSRSGFVIAGVALNNTQTPSARQLRDGLDFNNTKLVAFQRQFSANKSVNFNFTGLVNNTNYKIFMMSSNDDPGPDAFYSTVNFINIRTLSPNNFASRTGVFFMAIFAFILLAFV